MRHVLGRRRSAIPPAATAVAAHPASSARSVAFSRRPSAWKYSRSSRQCGKARFHFAPERAANGRRGSGGRARAPARTRTPTAAPAPAPGPAPARRRAQRAPLRRHHLEAQPRGARGSAGRYLRQPAADVGARLGFVELAQRRGAARHRRRARARGNAVASPSRAQPRVSALLQRSGSIVAAQRQRAVASRTSSGSVVVRVSARAARPAIRGARHEAVAGHQAGAQRQGQARAAFVDRRA